MARSRPNRFSGSMFTTFGLCFETVFTLRCTCYRFIFRGMGSSWKSCKIDRIVRVKWKKTFFFSWVRKRLKWDLNLWYKRGIARRGIILLIICRNEIEIDENDWGIRYCSKELNVARIIYNLEYLKKFRSLREYLNLVSEKSLRI